MEFCLQFHRHAPLIFWQYSLNKYATRLSTTVVFNIEVIRSLIEEPPRATDSEKYHPTSTTEEPSRPCQSGF